jgi:hypothetical protein
LLIGRIIQDVVHEVGRGAKRGHLAARLRQHEVLKRDQMLRIEAGKFVLIVVNRSVDE